MHLAFEDFLVGVLLPEVEVKPRLERVEVVKDGGEQKVEERPELGQVVLQRRAREEQPIAAGGVGQVLQLAQQPAVHVLEAVTLVDDNKLPLNLPEPAWRRRQPGTVRLRHGGHGGRRAGSAARASPGGRRFKLKLAALSEGVAGVGQGARRARWVRAARRAR